MALTAGADGSRQESSRQLLSREVVEGYQRQRVVPAVAELANEHGLAELTTSRIVKAARMSRNTFYELFGDRSSCLRFAFEAAYKHLFEPVRVAGAGEEPWLRRLGATLDAFFAAIAADLLLAELCLVHASGVVAEARGYDYQAGVTTLGEAMWGGREAGRAELGDDYHDPPPQIEEFLAGAIVSVASRRIRQGTATLLPEHRNELVQLAVRPFFGVDVARGIGARAEAGQGFR